MTAEAATRPPLTDQERRSIEAGAADLHLENRSITGLSIPAKVFERARLRDVDFVAVDFQGARFKGGSLENLSLTHCRLTDVTFEQLEATGLRLDECELTQVGFDRCQLRGWQVVGMQARQLGLSDCTVTDMEDDQGSYQGGAWTRVQLIGARWSRTELEGLKLENVGLDGGTLKQVKFTEPHATNWRFQSVEVDRLSVAFGEVSGLTLDGVGGRSLAFSSLRLTDMKVTRCALAGLTLAGVKCRGLVVEDCPQVTPLMLPDSEIVGLRVSRSKLGLLSLRGTNLTGVAVIEGCSMLGGDLEDAILDGLAIHASIIDGNLHAPRLRAKDLHLEGLRYGVNYHLSDEGATYQGGAFARKR